MESPSCLKSKQHFRLLSLIRRVTLKMSWKGNKQEPKSSQRLTPELKLNCTHTSARLQPQNAAPPGCCTNSQVSNEVHSWPPSFRPGEAMKKKPSAAALVVPWKALFAVTSHNWTGGDRLCVLASSPTAAVGSLRVANIKHSSATDWLIRRWNSSKADAAEFIPLELEHL